MKQIDRYTESFKMKYEAFLIGCDSIEEMGLWDKESHGEMDAFYSNDLTSVMIRLIAVDGAVTAREVDYLNKAFGFSYTVEELSEIYANCAEDIGQAFDENFENGITHMRRINTRLAEAYKELLALICRIIMESDGIVSAVETDEIKRLKAMCE